MALLTKAFTTLNTLRVGAARVRSAWIAVYQAIESFYSTFEPKKTDHTTDLLLSKSWFDALSASWAARSFGVKLGTLLSSSLILGCIGLFAHAFWALALTALVVATGIHYALVVHHMHRLEQLHRRADEAAHHTLLEHTVTEKLKEFNEELAAVHQHYEELTYCTSQLNASTDTLASVEHKVQEVIAEVTKEARDFTTTLHQTHEPAYQFGYSVQGFREVVTQIEDTQHELHQTTIELTQAVNEFTHPTERPPTPHQEFVQSRKQDELVQAHLEYHKAYLDQLEEQNQKSKENLVPQNNSQTTLLTVDEFPRGYTTQDTPSWLNELRLEYLEQRQALHRVKESMPHRNSTVDCLIEDVTAQMNARRARQHQRSTVLHAQTLFYTPHTSVNEAIAEDWSKAPYYSA